MIRRYHIGDSGVRKPGMRMDGTIMNNGNVDSLARLLILSHEGFKVGVGTIQVDGLVELFCYKISRVRFSFSVVSPGWCGAPLPNFPIPLVPGEAAQFMGLDARFGPRLGTCREEPQRSQPQGAGRPLPASRSLGGGKERLQEGGPWETARSGQKRCGEPCCGEPRPLCQVLLAGTSKG